jgi:hypothetical protein
MHPVLLNLLVIVAALCVAFPRIACLCVKHAGAAASVVFHNAIPVAFRMPLRLCAVNTIDADLKVEVILDTFLEALVEELLSITAFSTDLSSDAVNEGEEITVGYIPAAAAARTFDGSYTIQASDWQKKKVAIDQHEYVSWGLSDVDLYKSSLVNLKNQTRMKAQSLAEKVMANLLGAVTVANYGAAVLTTAAAGFDLDDVADLRTAARKAKWPKALRNLIIGADYYGNVLKGDVFQNANQAGGTGVRETGELPRLFSFQPFESEAIPDNGEKLVGFINMPSAMAVAMRYLKPRRPEKYIDARPITHKDTGITFGFRQDYDTKTGVEAYIFECNFGKAVLEPTALKRICSP